MRNEETTAISMTAAPRSERALAPTAIWRVFTTGGSALSTRTFRIGTG